MCKTEEETRPLLANTTRVKLPHYDSGVKTQEAATASTDKERRRGWPTLAAAFFSLFLLNGAEYGFGCLVEPLMEDTGLGRSAVSVAGSTQVQNIFRNNILTLKIFTPGRRLCLHRPGGGCAGHEAGLRAGERPRQPRGRGGSGGGQPGAGLAGGAGGGAERGGGGGLRADVHGRHGRRLQHILRGLAAPRAR